MRNLLVLFALLLSSISSFAIERIDITRGNIEPVPLANLQFSGSDPMAKETGKEISTQALYGMAGEAGGSLAIGQKLDPIQIIEEGLGEIAGAPIEATTTYQKNKTKVAEPKFVEDEKIIQNDKILNDKIQNNDTGMYFNFENIIKSNVYGIPNLVITIITILLMVLSNHPFPIKQTLQNFHMMIRFSI